MIAYRYAPALFVLSLAFLLPIPLPAEAQGFDDCLSNANNATVIVPSDLDGADDLSENDEIGIFTEDEVCAGRGVWDDDNFSIAAAGTDTQTEKGFEFGETLNYRIWDADSESVYEATVTYEPCDSDDPLCSDDGEYEDDTIFTLSEIDFEPDSDPKPLLSVSSESIDFGEVEKGSSRTETLEVENTGDADLEGSVNLDDGTGAFTLESGGGSFELAPGNSRPVDVTFEPDAAESYAATAEVTHNADNENDPLEVGLEGEGTDEEESSEPVIAVTTEALDFGEVEEGASQTETLTLENTGEADLDGSVALDDEAESFAIESDAGSYALDPGETLDVEVTFAPDEPGEYESSIQVEHNADNVSDPLAVSLIGEGAEEPTPAIAVSATSLEFGSVVVGQSATEKTTIENTGDAPLEGEVGLARSSQAFTLEREDSSYELDPGGALELEIIFAPDESGERTNDLEISHNASGEDTPIEVFLEGEGLAPALAVDAETIDFGEVEEGSSQTETLTLENTGDADLDGSVALDEDTDHFDLEAGGGDFTLEPGEALDVEVSFNPDGGSSYEDTLTITHNGEESPEPVEIDVEGTGVEVVSPIVVEAPSDQDLILGGDVAEMELNNVFDAPSGDELAFTSESSNDQVASVSVEEAVLSVGAVGTGSAEVTVSAENSDGTAETEFEASVESIAAQVSRSFDTLNDERSYRLVGLPGQVDVDVAETLEGPQGSGWRAFRETTSEDADEGLEEYNESAAFRFEPGRGFWVLAQDGLHFEEDVEALDLQKGEPSIDLHEGWNIISNPLAQHVEWTAVQAENGINEPLWHWDGSWREADAFESAREGGAYYFFNDAELDQLALPTSAEKEDELLAKREAPDASTMSLELDIEEAYTSTVELGLNMSGSQPRTDHAPPPHFEDQSLHIADPDSETRYARKVAPANDKGGYAFPVVLRSDADAPLELEVDGLGDMDQHAASLLQPTTGERHDLHDGATITITPTDETERLEIAVGTAEFVDEHAESVIPSELTLTSYPNPVRDRATIEYALPEPTDVRMELYDALGQRVQIIEDASAEAGEHQIDLNVRQLASGVYFCRIRTDDQTETSRITVVR